MLDLAKRSETAIYAIGLRQTDIRRPRFKEAEFVLRQLSQETAAFVSHQYRVGAAQDLPADFEELASQYSIAYTSKNRMRNGAWRIDVRIARPGLTARTRRGYFGPTAQ